MNEKNKNILLAILVVGVISMTIAFAALTTRLKLQGQANVAETKWNVRFNNWALDTENTVDGHRNTAIYPDAEDLDTSDESNITKVDGVNITLKQPGDYAKYTFEIENKGTIAAKLNSFTPTITNNSGNVIGYTVACYPTAAKTGEAITTNYVLGVNQKVYCLLKVEYNDTSNAQTPGQNQIYTQGELNTSISVEWQWIQDDTVANNNQGGGGNTPTPSNPYETDFSGTYQYMSTGDSEFGNTLDPLWNYYLRKNTSTNLVETCGVFGNQTVCITAGSYASEFTSPTPTGYTGGKNTEFQGKGVNCAYENGGLDCVDDPTTCYIGDDGGVSCANTYGEYHGCYVAPNSTYACY